MIRQHAILSASGSSRWIACTPSARLEEQFPDSTSEAAKEGTAAHALGELLLRKELKQIVGVKFKRELAKMQKGEYYNQAMYDHAEDYAIFVLERFADARQKTKDAILEIESKLDMTDWVPEGFGTGDAIIIADEVLDLIDMKYGKGVEVDATENTQLMLYGLGALAKYGFMYKIETVRMTIFQPRLDNFSSYEISTHDLLTWANEVLKPAAEKAFKGDGDFVVGPHCQFCRAKAVCKAHADYQLQIAKYELRNPDLLSDEEVSDVMDRAKDFASWIKAVGDYALNEALNNGRKWPGYKLVEGRSNRKITDEENAIKELRTLSYTDEQIFTIKLQGITHFETLMGKKQFAEKIGPYVTKPEGAPTLAPEYDKRPELKTADAAVKDFENVNITA